MTMSLEISVKSGKFCCKEYKFLNQSYNLLKVFPTNNCNENLINKCKSFKAKIITHNETFELDIYKIKFRCNEMRLFYDGNKYNSFFNKNFCSAILILSDIQDNHNVDNHHCSDCDNLSSMFKSDEHTHDNNNCSDCDNLSNMFKSDEHTHDNNNCSDCDN